MSEQNDFLRALLEDSEDEEGGEETAGPSASGENKTMKQIRDHVKSLERKLTAAQKQNEELVKFKNEVLVKETTNTVKSKFTEIYGDPAEAEKNAKLFFRGINDPSDVNEDAITEYLREFGPAQPAAQPGQVQGEAPVPQSSGGLAPATGGTAPVQGMVSSEDLLKAMAAGEWDVVTKAVESGRHQKAQYAWPTQARE